MKYLCINVNVMLLTDIKITAEFYEFCMFVHC